MKSKDDQFVFTNVRIFKEIADEAYSIMVAEMNSGRRPREDGADGWIITINPSQTSFKQAIISTTFTAIWLEANLHLAIVQHHGVKEYNKIDKKTYEDKLSYIGYNDNIVVEKVKRLRKERKEIVHEKAFLDDGGLTTAQDMAENAREIRIVLHEYFTERRAGIAPSAAAESG